ncbi:MAG: phosphatidylglycerophosphatase A [Bacteroidota bacterium]
MDTLKRIIGSGFGSGYTPVAPGTFGSLAALVPLTVILLTVGWPGVALFAVLSSIATLWVTPACEESWGKDPGRLVMDEWAGQALPFLIIPSTYAVPSTGITILAAFMLFRLFDIWKPLFINRLQELPGGWGVLTDDILAGFYTLICLKSVILLFPDFFGVA